MCRLLSVLTTGRPMSSYALADAARMDRKAVQSWLTEMEEAKLVVRAGTEPREGPGGRAYLWRWI
jgi:DNA-binding IclR family transcriptional regulator